MHSGVWRLRLIAVAGAAASICLAQTDVPTFGVTVVAPYGFCGKIYNIRPGKLQTAGCSTGLPQFQRMEPVGHIYATPLAVPLHDFREGFPGVTERIEWFAIEYAARFWVEKPGKYSFMLVSDDGSALYIDERKVVDNDCMHPIESASGSIQLDGGVHEMRVGYFQGSRWKVALELSVKPPGGSWRIFDTGDFGPPSNPADWKYSNPADLDAPLDPCAIAPRAPRQLIVRPGPKQR